MKKRITFVDFAIVLLSICAALMLNFEFSLKPNVEYSNLFNEMYSNIKRNITGKTLQLTICTIFFIVIGKSKENKVLKNLPYFLLSLFIAFIWLCAEGYRINNKLANIIHIGNLPKAIIYLLGATFIIYQGYRYLLCLLQSKLQQNYINNNTFIIVFFALLLCWSYSIVTCFPSNMCYDVWSQISQFWKVSIFTTQHPPIHTVLIGLFTKFGLLVFRDVKIGLFIFIIFQAFIYAAILAYSFVLMKKMRIPIPVMTTIFFIVAFSPYYSNYITLPLKDSLYSIFILLLTIELIYFLMDTDNFFKDKKHCFYFSISIFCVYSFRNNGKYILYPTFISILIYVLSLLHKGKTSKRTLYNSLFLISSVFLISKLVESNVISHYNAIPGSIREALSLPLQQTARYITKYGSEITDEEKNIISKIIDYDIIKEKYNPIISDPIKENFKQNASSENITEYLKLWAEMFIRHPGIYLSATLNQNYFLFYPFIENLKTYLTYEVSNSPHMRRLYESNLGFEHVPAFTEEKILLQDIFNILFSFPGIGLFSHPATYTIIFLGLLLTSLLENNLKLLIILIPNFFSLLVIIASPVINQNARYAFPIIYSLPVIFCFFIFEINNPTIANEINKYNLCDQEGTE